MMLQSDPSSNGGPSLASENENEMRETGWSPIYYGR